jgi:phosphatidylserine/phosphatidylglycerophosphate/cardiolipin synthase-like enzyme
MKKSIFICCLFLAFITINSVSFSASPQITLNYTSPGTTDYCKNTLSARLAALGVGHSAHINMYTLSNTDIIGYLRAFASRGGKICMVVDREQYNTSTGMGDKLRALSQHIGGRVKIRLLGNRGTGLNPWQNVKTLHEKVAILKNGESADVMIGSYNWTWTASDRNYENCMFLKTGVNVDINGVVNRSKTRFDDLWRASQSINVGESRDLECLFTPTGPEIKAIEAERAATIASPVVRGRSREIQHTTRVALSPVITPSKKRGF